MRGKENMKRAIALILALVLLMVVPAGAEEGYASARTPISEASEAQLTNINLAAYGIDQTIVGPYGEFSFNAHLGPRSADKGYVRAVNGRGSKVQGGGVAQVATTLYLALLELGNVEFGEIMTYGSRFTGGYVSDSSLAVVTDYDSDHDLSFVNLTDNELLLEMWTSDSYLYCTVSYLENDDFAATEDNNGWFLSAPSTGATSSQLVAYSQIYCGESSKLLNNVELCAGSIYDTTLAYGDEFSFNSLVGPRTEENGYVRAINGRGVKVVGGGVAQVASVIWLAVQDMDDVSIVEKSTYGKRYNQSYVASSSDAILTDYNAGTDFVFRYDGSGSITIYTWVEGDMLYCDIYRNY